MQNVDTKDFLKYLKDNGYEEVRVNGSHSIHKRVITDTISVPKAKKTINGCMAQRIKNKIETINSITNQING